MILTTPAKINLCLRVGPLRDDGFHRLATVFVAIVELKCTIRARARKEERLSSMVWSIIHRSIWSD